MLTKDQRRDLVAKWNAIRRSNPTAKRNRSTSSYQTTGVGYDESRINITFPCTAKNIHTLSFIKGDIFFFNHSIAELKAQAIMDHLNTPLLNDSTACGCVRFMRFLMEKARVNDMGYTFFHSSAIRDVFYYASQVRESRIEYNKAFPEPLPANVAIENKFCNIMHSVFTKHVSYRVPTKKDWNPNNGVYEDMPVPLKLTVSVGKEAGISGKLEEGGKNSDDVATVSVVLPLSYYSTVYNKGHAVVGGNIVLSKLFDFNNGSFMGLVGKQTYGYKVEAEHAIIHPDRQHISFITEEKARQIILLGKTPRSRRTKKELGK